MTKKHFMINNTMAISLFLLCITAVPATSFVPESIIHNIATVYDSPSMISATDAFERLETSDFMTVIDVRTSAEYENGHITKAISVPFVDASCWSCIFDNFDGDYQDAILVYDENSNASAAAKLLHDYGFAAVYCLKGGIHAWRSCNLPIVIENPPNNRDSVYATGCVSLERFEMKYEQNTCAVIDEIPVTWDWQYAEHNNIYGDWTTPPKNQGACGSCWDFAAMGALEAVINIRANDPTYDIDLSEQYLLSCPSNSGGCSGWNAYWAYSYIYRNGGAITETCFPYQANDGIACLEKCGDWQQKTFPITRFGSMTRADRDVIKSALITYGPLVAEMAVYGDFGSYDGGIYEHPGEEPTSAINHQVVIVGYNEDQSYWICKNSWGSWWGEDGFFKIAYGDCQIERNIIYVEVSPAIARLNGPYYLRSGESMIFDATASESLIGEINFYEWAFGDGFNGTGTKPTHVYDEEGRYRVTLTVTDTWGNQGVATTTVYVDNTAPTIEITSPEPNRFYFFDENKGYMPFRSFIIGYITIATSISDTLSGPAKIEIYFDRNLVTESEGTPIELLLSDAPFGFHTFTITAYDRAGNEATERVKIFTWM